MPLQNRVTPLGEIVADSARGTMMGNRGGCFHDHDQNLKRRPWASKVWITCVLEFKNRQRKVMSPGLYTELFFLDEATALAAGHRPCAECRRADFTNYSTLWNEIRGLPGRAYIKEMDPVLHRQRWASATDITPVIVTPSDEPNGVMIAIEGKPHLVWENFVWLWSLEGYVDPQRKACISRAQLITPQVTRDILAAGYRPQTHPSIPPSSLPDHPINEDQE